MDPVVLPEEGEGDGQRGGVREGERGQDTLDVDCVRREAWWGGMGDGDVEKVGPADPLVVDPFVFI